MKNDVTPDPPLDVRVNAYIAMVTQDAAQSCADGHYVAALAHAQVAEHLARVGQIIAGTKLLELSAGNHEKQGVSLAAVIAQERNVSYPGA